MKSQTPDVERRYTCSWVSVAGGPNFLKNKWMRRSSLAVIILLIERTIKQLKVKANVNISSEERLKPCRSNGNIKTAHHQYS